MKSFSKIIFPLFVVTHIVVRLALTPLFAQEQRCADDLIFDIQEQLLIAEKNLEDATILAVIEDAPILAGIE